MRAKPLDAVVLAGGRIHGEYAAAVGTEVKALAEVDGRACGARVVDALQAARQVGRVVVVGPESVRAALPAECEWAGETDSAYGNVHAGLEALAPAEGDQMLLCGADVPLLTPEAVDDFIARSPVDADFCLAVIRRERYQARFPGARNLYVRLAEGHFTGGSQYVVHPRAVRENEPVLRELVRRRKSQLGMVKTFGLRFIWRLLTGRLTIPELEQRASDLTHARCRAVPDCAPELAYDIDHLPDWEYLRK